jgi:hypothetical protein
MKHEFLAALSATTLIALAAGASAAESYAEKTTAKSEFQGHVEKAGERAREAREARATAEGNRTREAAGLDHGGRLSVGEGKSIGVSRSESGVTVNGRIDRK